MKLLVTFSTEKPLFNKEKKIQIKIKNIITPIHMRNLYMLHSTCAIIYKKKKSFVTLFFCLQGTFCGIFPLYMCDVLLLLSLLFICKKKKKETHTYISTIIIIIITGGTPTLA